LVLNLTDDGIILGWRSQVDSKMWRLDENGVIHSKTGSVIEIPGSNTDQGVALRGCHDGHGGENQRFTFDGSAIRSHLNQFVFDVEEGLMEVGSALCVWPHQGGDNQTFKFVQVSTRRRARNLRASSDNVEVKLAKTTEGIPEGWYQATVEEAEAHSELILAKMGKWWIGQLVGGWINGRGYGGNVEAKGHRDLGHRVLMKRIRQRRATSDQGNWEGVEITKKEMKNITMAIQVFGDGQDIKRVAKITKESFEDILKRVDDRQKESSKRNVALTYEAEQAKTKKRQMEADLAKKTAELNRQSNQLKRLKGELERSYASLRNSQRDLARGEREVEAQKRAHEKAQTAQTVFGVLSFIPGLNLIGLAGVAGSGIAKGAISANINGLKGKVRAQQRMVDMHEKLTREKRADKERSKNEEAKLNRALVQLQRERRAIKDKIASIVIENKRCASLLEEIRGAHIKVIEMNNAANNMDTRAEKAFDMEQMAIPLNELLISLEENIDVLDEGAKAELQLARVKFNKFNSALEAQEGDAVDF